MKKIVFYIGLLFLQAANADELALGLVTAHIYNIPGVSQKYSGCLNSSCEIIYNPVVAYRFTNDKYYNGLDKTRTRWIKEKEAYMSNTFLVGLNSVHEPMAGYYLSFGIWAGSHKIGWAGGMYFQDNNKFRQKNVMPFSVYEVRGTGFVPIMGLEHQYFIDKKIFTSILVTPVVANFGLGFSF